MRAAKTAMHADGRATAADVVAEIGAAAMGAAAALPDSAPARRRKAGMVAAATSTYAKIAARCAIRFRQMRRAANAHKAIARAMTGLRVIGPRIAAHMGIVRKVTGRRAIALAAIARKVIGPKVIARKATNPEATVSHTPMAASARLLAATPGKSAR